MVGGRVRGSRSPPMTSCGWSRPRPGRCAGRADDDGRLSPQAFAPDDSALVITATARSCASISRPGRRPRSAKRRPRRRGAAEAGRADPRPQHRGARRRRSRRGRRHLPRRPVEPRRAPARLRPGGEPGRLLVSARRRGRGGAGRPAARAGRADLAARSWRTPGPPTGAWPSIARRTSPPTGAGSAIRGRSGSRATTTWSPAAGTRRSGACMLRVARSLKAGAEREPVLARMRRDMAPVQDRYDEVERHDRARRDRRRARPLAPRGRLRGRRGRRRVHVLRPFLLAVALLAPTGGARRAPRSACSTRSRAPRASSVRDADQQLLGWTDDGTALWVRDGRRVLRVSVADGSATREPRLDDAEAIGPGGQWAGDGEIHARGRPHGRPLRRLAAGRGRAAEDRLVARRGARGRAQRRRTPSETALTVAGLRHGDRRAAGAPRRHRGPLAAGVRAGRERAPRRHAQGRAAARRAGREPARATAADVAVRPDRGVERERHASRSPSTAGSTWSGGPRIGVDDAEIIAYSGDGTLLAYRYLDRADACSYPQSGLDVVAPGRPPHVVLAPGDGELRRFAWAPGGHMLAVDLEPAPAPEPRGKRHPWPKRVATDYAMPTRAGDRALRRMVLRAARSLRHGATREAVLARVRRDYSAVEARSRPPGRPQCARRSRTSSTNGSTPPAGRGSARSASSAAEPTRAASPRRTRACPPRSPRRR